MKEEPLIESKASRIMTLVVLYAFTSILLNLGMFYVIVVPTLDVLVRSNSRQSIEWVTVTAYSSEVGQTDSTPYVNAAMMRVRPGDIAVSRDLFLNGWTFEKRVWIQDEGIFIIRDLMATKSRRTGKKINRAMDIYMTSTKTAWDFGRKDRVAVLFEEGR